MKNQPTPATPAEYEGWWVEFGPKDKRKAGRSLAGTGGML